MRKLGTISCIEVAPTSNRVKPGSSPLTLILFHGYGADAYDLQSLSDAIIPPQETQWLFPQGILEVPIGPGWTGRAWWPIDIARLEAANRGEPFDFSSSKPDGLDALRVRIDQMIAELKTPWSNIILGGFSQGAMLATDTFLRASENPKGLIVLSGALVNKEEWKKLAPNRKGSPVFMSHGKNDAILPLRSASQLESLLIGAGLKGSLMSFDGGHEIPYTVIERANQWLKTI